MIKCPKCKKMVCPKDVVSADLGFSADGKTIFQTMLGTCPECKVPFHWDEKFVFESCVNIQKDNIIMAR